jgi:ribosomal protein S18 acetylase RimI-like enzyme
MAPVTFRFATSDDSAAVGSLHAESWRRHYRGAYSDAYLDGPVHEDRIALWSERLGGGGAGRFTIVAEDEGELLGFAHTHLDADPHWGSLLDNLHVTVARKRQGIGAQLLARSAHELLERRPGGALYLWVLEQNTAAQAFYAALGGSISGSELRGPFPGGGTAPALRIAWREPGMLVDGRARRART